MISSVLEHRNTIHRFPDFAASRLGLKPVKTCRQSYVFALSAKTPRLAHASPNKSLQRSWTHKVLGRGGRARAHTSAGAPAC